MKYTKLSAAAALAASSALILSACAPGGSDDSGDNGDNGGAANGDGGTAAAHTGDFGEKYSVEPADSGMADLGDVTTQEGQIAYSVGEDEFSAYNGGQTNTYSTYNSVVADRLFGGFWYYGTDGAIIHNDEFGTYEKISDEPLQVKYTINEDANWSDGTPVTAADYIVQWATGNGNIQDPDGEPNAEGELPPLFDTITTDPGEYIPEAPEGDATGKEFTVTYNQPYADWEIMLNSALPAHVIADQAGMSLEELVEASRNMDAEALAPAAEFWNDGWDFNPGELPDMALIPSSGPYKLKEGGWTAGQFITLEANPDYVGTPAATKELVIRFAAADTHPQSLQNQELDVIEPQATVDTLEQLEGMGDQVIVQTGQELTWEHIDFNWKEGSVFSGEDPAIREAFAMCLPRQDIVDRLIKPISDDAVVMNAREIFPFQEGYDEVVEYAYDSAMDQPDIERSKQLLEEADAVGTTVRLGYNGPNPRRSETVSLIAASCNEAGFDIQDAGDPNFFTEVQPAGDYDAALFAWAGSGQKTSGRNIHHTNGQQNYGGYSNETVDSEFDALTSELDEAAQREHIKEIEKAMWEDFNVIPLYAHPGVLAQRADLANVRHTSTQNGAVWNVEQWLRVE